MSVKMLFEDDIFRILSFSSPLFEVKMQGGKLESRLRDVRGQSWLLLASCLRGEPGQACSATGIPHPGPRPDALRGRAPFEVILYPTFLHFPCKGPVEEA